MEILRRHIVFVILFCIGTAVAQQHPVDIIYSSLDEFLEQPNPESLIKLQNSINSIVETDKEVQLAKTIAYCNIGYVETQNAALQQAINSYEKAKQLYFSENLSNYDIIEYCLKPLGNLYIKTQALSEAENTIKHYILFAQETGQKHQEISGILNLSVLYHNRGEFEKSKTILLQALEKEPSNLDLKLNLASTFFALGQKEETKKLLKNILITSSDNVQAYQLSAQVFLSEKEYSKAVSSLQKALKLLGDRSGTNVRQVAKIHVSLAETYLAAEQFPKTISELQNVYKQLLPTYKNEQQTPTKEQLYAETTLMDALDLHAVALSQIEDSRASLRAFELAALVSDFLFVELYMQDSKLIVQQNVKRRSELIMELLYQQYQKTRDLEWIEKAIDLDSKTKGRIVSEAVYLKNILDSKRGNKSNKFQNLQKELSFLANEIKKETQKDNFDFEKLTSLQKSYSEAITQQRMLYDDIQEEMQAANQVWEATGLKEIREKTTRLNQSLVSFFMGSGAIYQFIISEDEVSFTKLTDSQGDYEDFRESIRSYNRFFDSPAVINNDIDAFSKASYDLYRKLNLPDAEKLIVIPDGLLTFVPFQTLLTKKTEFRQYSQMPFLIYHSSVSYLLSTRDYLRDEISFQKEQTVLGVFPVFKSTSQELSYSTYEAKSIEKMFPSKMLMESQATGERFSRESDKHSIVHIATHALGGTFNEKASIQFFDRTLNVAELYSLSFPADLVVLSACDTGIGQLIKGEGALSLARAFQYAGAGNIMFSLWQVNDKSTAELMAYYYQNLKKFQSRDFALHRASLDYLQDKTIDNSRKSPYYWGAFVYYGTADLPQESEGFNWYLVIGGVLIALIIFIVYKMGRRRFIPSSNP